MKNLRYKSALLGLIGEHLRGNYEKEKPFVPGVDTIPVSGTKITNEDILTVVDAVLDGWFTEGRYHKLFEDRFKNFLGARHVTLCNSGSSANLLALAGVDEYFGQVGQGYRPYYVITSALAFPTTVAPILQLGFVPLFVDSSSLTLTPYITDILEALERKNVAGVMLAHTLGFPFRADRIAEKCKELRKFFVEDCCDAIGTELYYKKVGNFGDASTFSFFPAHHITMGEGGAVVSNNGRLNRIIKSFANWGRDCWCVPGKSNTCNKRFEWQLGDLPFGYDHKYTFTRLGYNLKITELQAALGYSQLQRIEDVIKIRRENFNYLQQHFIDTRLSNKGISVIHLDYTIKPSPFGFPISVNPNFGCLASELIAYLQEHKIETRRIFAGNITKHPMIKNQYYETSGLLIGTDRIMEDAFWIGCHDALEKEHLDYMIEVIDSYVKGK